MTRLKLEKEIEALKNHNTTFNNVFPKLSYSVIIADVDYGLEKKESRGDVEWTYDDFCGFFSNVKEANEAHYSTFIVFLHDRQIAVTNALLFS